jgi:DNA-binding beta-propeller fold protein YncE
VSASRGRNYLLLGVAALAALSLAPASATGAAPAATCASGGVTLATTAQVRVTSSGRGARDRVAVCSRRTGTTTELGDYGTCEGEGQIDRRIIVAGRRIAVSGFSCPGDAITAWILVVDADSGTTTRHPAMTGRATGDADEQATGLVLAPSGSVAWIAQRNTGSTVRREVTRARAGRPAVTIDRGARITACSLTLRGSTLAWVNGGAVRAAKL